MEENAIINLKHLFIIFGVVAINANLYPVAIIKKSSGQLSQENVVLIFPECSGNFLGAIASNVGNCSDILDVKKELASLRNEVLFLR